MKNRISEAIQDSIELKQKILDDNFLLETIEKVVELCTNCLQSGGKILFCGNGGSAADAQHLAAELSGRFYYDRDPLFAEALHVNTSYLTAVANDYSYDEIYSRLVKAKGREGDVIFGISTSGNSMNILKAFDMAKKLKMISIGMTNHSGGKMNNSSDYLLKMPSFDTPRIQEAHILVGHIICELIEKNIFPK